MKKLSKVVLLMLMIIPMFYFTACKSKVASINVEDMKIEFAFGEDFEVGDDFTIELVNKNKKTETISVSDLEKKSDTLLENEEISIDFSDYKKNQIGEYSIVVTYKKSKVTTTYTVKVVANQFTSDDYVIENYRGLYDGKYHTIKITENVGATIKYGYAEGSYTLNEPISFKQAGTFYVYYKIEKSGYEPPVEGVGTVEILKPTLTVTPRSVVIKYNQNFANQGCDYEGFIEGESIDTYPRRGTPEYTTNYLKGNDVGTYDIYLRGINIANYEIEYRTGTLQVEKSANDLRVDINNITYGSIFNPIVNNPAEAEAEYSVRYTLVGENDWHEGYPKSIGEYTIQYSTPSTKNFDSALVSVNASINPKELVITPNDVTIAYGESFADNGAKYESFVNGESAENLNGRLIYTTDYSVGDDVGTYHITIEGCTSQNYNIVYREATLTVQQAENVLNVQIANTVYGTPINPIVVENRAESDLTYTYNNINGYPTAVGTYDITVSSVGTKNYKKSEIVVKDVKIEKKDLYIKPNDVTIKYNEYYFEDGFDFQGFVYNETRSVLSGTLTHTTDYECGNDVGIYEVNYSGYESANYNIIYQPGKIIVTQATRTFEIDLPNTVYGTDLVVLNTEHIEKDNDVEPVISYEYKLSTEEDFTASDKMPTVVGQYDIKVLLAETKNYEADSKLFEGVTIEKKNINVTPKETRIKYNDSEETISYTGVDYTSDYSGESAFAYNEDASVFSGELVYVTDYTKGSNVGTYNIDVSGITAQNYNIVFKQGFKRLVVEKAENIIVASVQEITYGEVPNPTVTQNPSGESLRFEYQIEGTEEWLTYPRNAGTYLVRVTCPENKNYETVENMLLEDKLVINKKDLTITANNKTIKYNQDYRGDNPATDITIDGLVNNDKVGSLQGTLQCTIADFTKGADVGEYVVQISGYTSDNYNITFNNGTLTVEQAENELVVEIFSKVYGESLEPNSDAIFNPSNGELAYSYKLQSENVWTDGLPTNVGEYDIKVVSAETKNYLSATLQKTATITPAQIQISPNTVSIKYGEEFVNSGVTISGYVNDEDEKIFKGELVYTTEYVVGSDAGHYDINVSGFTADNYTIKYNVGTLEVSQAENTLKTVVKNAVYGDSIAIEFSDTNSNEDITIRYTNTETGDIYANGDAPKNVGTYTITIEQKSNKNYGRYYQVVENVTISARRLEVQWGELEFEYDGNVHYPEVTIKNLAYDDDCTLTKNAGNTNANESGYQAILYGIADTQTGEANSNYLLPYDSSVTYYITRKAIEIQESIPSKVYTGYDISSDVDVPQEYQGIYTVENVSVKETGIYGVKFSIMNTNYKFKGNYPDIITLNFEVVKANDNEILTDAVASEDYSPNNQYNDIRIQSKYGIVIVTYKDATDETASYSVTRPTNAGVYSIRAYVPETNSYNECEQFYNYTIYKIDPNYTRPDKVVISAGHQDFDENKFNKSKIGEVTLPTIENGVFSWEDDNYEITDNDVDNVEIKVNAIFTPFDETNYNTITVDVDVHIVDTRTLTFDDSEIIISSVEEDFTGSSIGTTIELSGKAENAKLAYTSDIYKEEKDRSYSDGLPSYINVGEYRFIVKVTKLDEVSYKNIEHTTDIYGNIQEIEVVYTYSRSYDIYYTDIISIKINDYIQSVIWNYVNNIAIIKNNALNLNPYYFDIVYASGIQDSMSGSEFNVVGFNSSVVGEQSITLEKYNRTYENVMNVFVYSRFIDGFKFKYETEVGTEKVSDHEFNVKFTALSQLYYNDEAEYLTIEGDNIYGAYARFDSLTDIQIDEGITYNTANINVNINGYVDVYKLNITTEISKFDITIDNLLPVYSSETDTYIFDKVVSTNYNSISLSYTQLSAIYEPDETVFTNSTNILTRAEYGNNSAKVLFKDFAKSILEFRANYVSFRLNIDVTTRDLPVQKVTVDGKDYDVEGATSTIEARVGMNVNVDVEFASFDGCYASIFLNGEKVWLDDTNKIITLESTVSQDGSRYYFEIYTAKEGGTLIQNVVIHFIQENYIEKFTIQTTEKTYDVTHAESLRVPGNEYVSGLEILMAENYTYKLYINGELANINSIVFTSSSVTTNNIAIVTYDSSDKVVSYTYFTLELEFYHGGITYSNNGELVTYASGKTLVENDILYVTNENKVFYFDYTSKDYSEQDTVFTINGVEKEFNTRLELPLGLNRISLKVMDNQKVLSEYTSYIYVLDENEEYIEESSHVSEYSVYDVYYDGSMIAENIANKNLSYNTDTYSIDTSKITLVDDSENVLDKSKVYIDGEFIIVTITTEEDTRLVNIIRMILNDIEFSPYYGNLVYSVSETESAILENNSTAYIAEASLTDMSLDFIYQITRPDLKYSVKLIVNGEEIEFETQVVDNESIIIPTKVTLLNGLNRIKIEALINETIFAKNESYIYVYSDEINVSSSSYYDEFASYDVYYKGEYAITNIAGYNLIMYVDNYDIDLNDIIVQNYNAEILTVGVTRDNDILYFRWTYHDEENNIDLNFINTVKLVLNYSDFETSYGKVVYSINDELVYQTEFRTSDPIEYRSVKYFAKEYNEFYFDYSVNDTIHAYTTKLYINGIERQLREKVELSEEINVVSLYVSVEGALTVKYEGYIYLLKAEEQDVETSSYRQYYTNYNVYYNNSMIFSDITVPGKNYYVNSYNIDTSDFEFKTDNGEILNVETNVVGNIVYLKWTHHDVENDKYVILVNTIKLNLNNSVIDNNTDADIYYVDMNNRATVMTFDTNNEASIQVYQEDSFAVILANKYATTEIEIENEQPGENIGGNYIYVRDQAGITKTITITVISSDKTATKTYKITIEIQEKEAFSATHTKPDLTSATTKIMSKEYQLSGAMFTATNYNYSLGVLTESIDDYVICDSQGNTYTQGDRYVKLSFASQFEDFALYTDIDGENLINPIDDITNAILQIKNNGTYDYYEYYVIFSGIVVKMEVYFTDDTMDTVEFTFNYTVDEEVKSLDYKVTIFDDKLFGENYLIGMSMMEDSRNAVTGKFVGSDDVYYVLYGYEVYADEEYQSLVAYIGIDDTGRYFVNSSNTVGISTGTEFIFNTVKGTVHTLAVESEELTEYTTNNTTVNMSVNVTTSSAVISEIGSMEIDKFGEITSTPYDDITNFDANITAGDYENYIYLKLTVGDSVYNIILTLTMM